MAKDSFVFRCDYIEKLSQFSTTDLGEIIKAIAEYVQSGVVPELNASLMIAFNIIKVDIDKDLQRYEERCKINKEIATNRWNKNNK